LARSAGFEPATYGLEGAAEYHKNQTLNCKLGDFWLTVNQWVSNGFANQGALL